MKLDSCRHWVQSFTVCEQRCRWKGSSVKQRAGNRMWDVTVTPYRRACHPRHLTKASALPASFSLT